MKNNNAGHIVTNMLVLSHYALFSSSSSGHNEQPLFIWRCNVVQLSKDMSLDN